MEREREKFNPKLYHQKWWLMTVTTVLSSTAGEPRENILSKPQQKHPRTECTRRGERARRKSFFIPFSEAFRFSSMSFSRTFFPSSNICPRSISFWRLCWYFCEDFSENFLSDNIWRCRIQFSIPPPLSLSHSHVSSSMNFECLFFPLHSSQKPFAYVMPVTNDEWLIFIEELTCSKSQRVFSCPLSLSTPHPPYRVCNKTVH